MCLFKEVWGFKRCYRCFYCTFERPQRETWRSRYSKHLIVNIWHRHWLIIKKQTPETSKRGRTECRSADPLWYVCVFSLCVPTGASARLFLWRAAGRWKTRVCVSSSSPLICGFHRRPWTEETWPLSFLLLLLRWLSPRRDTPPYRTSDPGTSFYLGGKRKNVSSHRNWKTLKKNIITNSRKYQIYGSHKRSWFDIYAIFLAFPRWTNFTTSFHFQWLLIKDVNAKKQKQMNIFLILIFKGFCTKP